MKTVILYLLLSFAILPEGSVKDEASFLMLVSILAVLVSVAVVLRLRKRNETN